MTIALRMLAWIAASICSGCVFALATAIADPELIRWLPVVLVYGGVIGFLLSPATLFATALDKSRPSFVAVFAPTLAVTFVVSAIGGPGLGTLASVVVYVVLCVTVGVIAIRRSKHLKWYNSNRCSTCGYDLSGLDGTLCPECGKVARVRPKIRVPSAIERP